jgi:hypothetical protein
MKVYVCYTYVTSKACWVKAPEITGHFRYTLASARWSRKRGRKSTDLFRTYTYPEDSKCILSPLPMKPQSYSRCQCNRQQQQSRSRIIAWNCVCQGKQIIVYQQRPGSLKLIPFHAILNNNATRTKEVEV